MFPYDSNIESSIQILMSNSLIILWEVPPQLERNSAKRKQTKSEMISTVESMLSRRNSNASSTR